MHSMRAGLGLLILLCAQQATSGIRMVLLQKIDVGRQPHNLTMTPDRRAIYVTNLQDNSVSVISWPQKRVSTISVCNEPWVVAAAPDSSVVVVGCRVGLAVISIKTKHVTMIKCCGWVWDVVFTKDGRSVYIAAQRAGLFRMDIRTFRVEMVDSTSAVMKLALMPDGKSLYVNYQSSGPGGRPGHDAIGQLDVSSGRLIQTILHLPNVGGPLAVSPDGKRLWANGYDACLSRRYDHEGCPIVPASIVNVLSLPDHAVLLHIARPDRFVRQMLSFSRSGRFMVISGEDPVLYDARTLAVLATAPGYRTVDWIFVHDDDVGMTTLNEENRVAVFLLVRD